MCGLAGFIETGTPDREEYRRVVAQMALAVEHRGPDDAGVWVDPNAGIALGHRRLSILDLSPAGHQPMVSGNGRHVIAFNGEIYNHLELRARLEDQNSKIKWRGHSDTETLVNCFDAWGIEKTLADAVGMFAFSLWDRETRTLYLARDRMGEKPLYYGWQGKTFLFGSELKALKAHPGFDAEVDRGALTLLLRHNYVPAPHSIYRNVHKLLPGCYLQMRIGGSTGMDATQLKESTEIHKYWSLVQVAERGMARPFAGTDEDALDATTKLLEKAVAEQMVADVPLGSLLSGGIDSTVVTALMQSNSNRPVNTFSIGFNEKAYSEAGHARKVANHLGTDHTELILDAKDALALVPKIATIYDEPFADSSQLPTWLVMNMARQHVTVALSGDAGDETFGGYNRYVHVPKVWNRVGWMPMFLRRTMGAGLTAFPSTMLNRTVGPMAALVNIAQPGDKMHKLGQRLRNIDSVDDLYVSLVSEWSQPDKVVTGGHVPPNLISDRNSWPEVADPVSRMMLLDGLTYLPDDILAKVDRAGMAVSLETRAPFLDRNVIEFAWTLPMHMKIRDGQGKWLLRGLLDRYIPRELVQRPKMGFGIPLDSWLRGPLKDWAEDLLSQDRLRNEGFFTPQPIRKAWKNHLTGAANGQRLWSVLMFQSWLESQRNY